MVGTPKGGGCAVTRIREIGQHVLPTVQHVQTGVVHLPTATAVRQLYARRTRLDGAARAGPGTAASMSRSMGGSAARAKSGRTAAQTTAAPKSLRMDEETVLPNSAYSRYGYIRHLSQITQKVSATGSSCENIILEFSSLLLL